jgi:hypothetical protein
MNSQTDERVKSSDQLPEDAPAEQVPDDVAEAQEGAARETGRRHAQRASSPRRQRDGDGEDTQRR